MLTKSEFARIERWMLRCARPLELAQWRFYFNNGSMADVLTALAAFQNDDGGFANALEADNWNPTSTPMTTATAATLLHTMGFRDATHPLVQKMLTYIEANFGTDGDGWAACIPSNNDHPHAPWWTYISKEALADWGYNPGLILAAFVLENAAPDSPLYNKALLYATAAYKRYMEGIEPDGKPYRATFREMELVCFSMLADACEAAAVPGIDPAALRRAFNEQADLQMEKDPAKWSGYCHPPLEFILTPASPLYAPNKALVEQQLTFMLATRAADGVWTVPWRWADYPAEFAVSVQWWRGSIALRNTLSLKTFGLLEA